MKLKEHLNQAELERYESILVYMYTAKPVFPKRFIEHALTKVNFPDDTICKVSQAIGEHVAPGYAKELMIWSKVFGVWELMVGGRSYESYFSKMSRKCPDTEFYNFSDVTPLDELLDMCYIQGVKKGQITEFVNNLKRILNLNW